MGFVASHESLFAWFGALSASYLLVRASLGLGRNLWMYVVSRAIGDSIDWKKYGPWALVTGATDGIGRAYADALATKGLNVVIVSRSEEKLQKTAEEIESKHGIRVKYVVADFAEEGTGLYDRIKEEIAGIEIGTLVNNVGMSYAYPEYLLDIPNGRKKISDLINVNITSCVTMTHMLLRDMAERGRGLVINISSASADRPSPLLNVYAAAKVFVEYFSIALDKEYRSKGIIVQCVKPGFVVSKLSGIKRPSFIAPLPETFVKSAIATIGKGPSTYGFFPHWLQLGLGGAVAPQFVTDAIQFSILMSTRKRALKKLKRSE